MTRGTFFRIIYVLLAACFLFVSMVLYWTIYDDNFNRPSELYPQEYTSVVPAGGSFKARFISLRFRDCYIASTRVFTNERTGERYEENRNSRLTIAREGEERVIEVPLPDDLAPGDYSYDARISYFCNPANNLFGPIVLDPPPLFFRISPAGTTYEWEAYTDRLQEFYRKR